MGERSIARAKLWQANEFAFDKLGQYRAESDHKAERDPRTQASRACPFAEKEEQSGLCSDVTRAVSLDRLECGLIPEFYPGNQHSYRRLNL